MNEEEIKKIDKKINSITDSIANKYSEIRGLEEKRNTYEKDLKNIQDLIKQLNKSSEKSSDGNTDINKLKSDIKEVLCSNNLNLIISEVGNINKKNNSLINEAIIVANNIENEISDYITKTNNNISNIESSITGLESEKRNLYIKIGMSIIDLLKSEY